MDTTMDRPTLRTSQVRRAAPSAPYGTFGSPSDLTNLAGLTFQQTMQDVLGVWEHCSQGLYDAHEMYVLGSALGTMDHAVWITGGDDVHRSGTDLVVFAHEYVLEAEVAVVEPLRPLVITDDFRD